MTALKKTVRTRRGVEPTGRPARREVELGKKSTNELAQIVLRSAIFLIRKGALRPPAGSAAPTRRERAREPWGDGY